MHARREQIQQPPRRNTNEASGGKSKRQRGRREVRGCRRLAPAGSFSAASFRIPRRRLPIKGFGGHIRAPVPTTTDRWKPPCHAHYLNVRGAPLGHHLAAQAMSDGTRIAYAYEVVLTR